MGKKIEKKVYKTNKPLLKKILIGTIILIIIGVFAVPVKNGIELLYLNSWQAYKIEKFGFEVSLPRAYKDIEVSDKDLLGISASAFTTDTSIEVNEEYVSKKPEIVYNGGNILNGVSLMIQCLNTEKTSKSLDEIAEGQHILVTIYYEDDYNIGELEKEYVTILGNEGIRTKIDISNEDDGAKTFVTYLVSLQDKEITITFFGKKENIENSIEEIEKIVSEIK